MLLTPQTRVSAALRGLLNLRVGAQHVDGDAVNRRRRLDIFGAVDLPGAMFVGIRLALVTVVLVQLVVFVCASLTQQL